MKPGSNSRLVESDVRLDYLVFRTSFNTFLFYFSNLCTNLIFPSSDEKIPLSSKSVDHLRNEYHWIAPTLFFWGEPPRRVFNYSHLIWLSRVMRPLPQAPPYAAHIIRFLLSTTHVCVVHFIMHIIFVVRCVSVNSKLKSRKILILYSIAKLKRMSGVGAQLREKSGVREID